METHHEAALLAMLDQLYLEGACCLRWDRLYLWYGVQRLAKRSYRDLLTRWSSYCQERGVEPGTLRLLSGAHTLTLLRDAFDGEQIETLESWT